MGGTVSTFFMFLLYFVGGGQFLFAFGGHFIIAPDKGEAAILFSTDVNALPIAVIETFILRWQLEVTFEEARAHLGMETQRQWSDNAIDRITPCILASYSIISLLALATVKSKNEDIPVHTSSWYKKSHVTFSDALTYVRGKILKTKYMHRFNKNNEIEDIDLKKIIEQLAAA